MQCRQTSYNVIASCRVMTPEELYQVMIVFGTRGWVRDNDMHRSGGMDGWFGKGGSPGERRTGGEPAAASDGTICGGKRFVQDRSQE